MLEVPDYSYGARVVGNECGREIVDCIEVVGEDLLRLVGKSWRSSLVVE